MDIADVWNLEGFMPSEFKSKKNFDEIFDNHDLTTGRMISGSKSGYRSKYPDHQSIFNANIVTESTGKIWYGDLDLTIDSTALQEICNELKEPLYVLYEMDGRFENENQSISFYEKKAVKTFKPQKV